MPSKDLKVTLLGDDRTGGAFNSAGRNADGLGKKFASLGKGIAVGLGGAIATGLAGLGVAMVQGFKDAASYEKITAQVAQTIKSTGNAAGVSAEGIKKYAGELESMSGVDEELILSGQNVLLTFTRIKNGVGEGNDIFNQASEAALNLSTTMGGDLVGANTLVGKALNDPIAGMTALRRAGVQLTEAQQDQIKTMVESGDLMGAQKVLLGELETQFGGAAKAAGQGLTGSIARAKDAFQDMFRGIATALLPKLTEFMEFVANRLMPGLQGLYDLLVKGDFTSALRDAFGWEEDSGIVNFLFGVRDAVIAVRDAFQGGGDSASGSMGRVQSAVATVVEFCRTAFASLRDIISSTVTIVTALWDQFGANMMRSLQSSLNNIVMVLQGALNIIKGVLDVFIGVFSGDWSRAWDGVKAIFSGVWDVIRGIVGQAINMIQTALSTLMTAIGGIVRAGWNAVTTATSNAWNGITGAVSGAWGRINHAVATGVNTAIDWVRDLPGRALGALGNVGSLLYNAGKDLIQGFINGIKGAIGGVKDTLGGLTSKLTSWKGPPEKDRVLLRGAGQQVIDGFIRGLESRYTAVRSSLQGLTADLAGPSLAVAGGVSGAAGGGGLASRALAPVASQSVGIDYERLARAVRGGGVHIQEYNEARQSVHEIAEDLTFLARTRV